MSSNLVVTGIDVGLNGGITTIKDGNILSKIVMPTYNIKKSGKTKKEYNIAEIINEFQLTKPNKVFIERQRAMPLQGVTSMFRIGYGFGLLVGICAGMGIPYEIVEPKKWQNAIFKDLKSHGGDTKSMSYAVCSKLWPNETWIRNERCSKIHDGLTDSACIALYGYNKEINGD